MTDDFRPPIKTRTTKELLAIAGAPKKWNPRAYKLATNELHLRKVDFKLIHQAKYIEKKKENLEVLKKAKESYSIFDFLFNLGGTLIEIIFSWNLEKEGYLTKAQQQKKFRILLFFIIAFAYLLSI
ncbi:hypothetical protein [Flavobacterium sp. DG2-3]|uniref:hypothetical protein n=1 Tax=Flavobacterium sp. DG2-3 TaxID=3068317 RepID=UPI00273DD0B9|nr:hypothetical protein [Flavobacterium sp. DG2-3]MDP5199413.1 hypothetical protein [Flavobacterium sp. DG2-3]